MTATASAPLSVGAVPADVARTLAAAGAAVQACLQCRKCTNGCPVAARADLAPHQIVRMVQLGHLDALLASRVIWECTSCQTCATRCPQQVDIAALNDALRRLSRAAGKADPKSTVPTFNDIFLRTVRRQGRMYEAGLMGSYKLRTRRFFADLEKVPLMLRKGKLALLPPMVRGYWARRRLFQRARKAGGKV